MSMDDEEKGPERTCIVTRRKAAPEAMIRFVLDPELHVVPDIRRRLPGRGVWVSASQHLVQKAVRGGAFARSFKAKAVASAELPEEVAVLLIRDALQSLSMVNKAGAVVTGFAKVESALTAGPVAALLHATEAADDGVRKLDRLADRCAAARGADAVSLKLFSSQQLDLALGRTNVIHAALAEGPASAAFLTRCRRSVLYRADGAHPDADAIRVSA